MSYDWFILGLWCVCALGYTWRYIEWETSNSKRELFAWVWSYRLHKVPPWRSLSFNRLLFRHHHHGSSWLRLPGTIPHYSSSLVFLINRKPNGSNPKTKTKMIGVFLERWTMVGSLLREKRLHQGQLRRRKPIHPRTKHFSRRPHHKLQATRSGHSRPHSSFRRSYDR